MNNKIANSAFYILSYSTKNEITGLFNSADQTLQINKVSPTD